MRRFLLIFLSLALLLSALAVGVAWYLLNSETFLKSRLHSYILAETGRELTVGQSLRLKIGRRLLVVAEDIRLQNAAWAEDPYMARVGRLRLVLDIPTLLADTTIVHSLRIEDCSIDLIETDSGASNWDDLMALGDDIEEEIVPAADEALPFLFRDNTIRNCHLTHRAPSRQQPLSLEIEELDLGLIDDIRWQGNGRGKLNDETLALSGWFEPAGVFINGGALEHDLEIKAGQVTLKSEGTVQDVYSGQGADVRLRFQGPEIANVLAYFDLPRVSSGEFDFRLSLDSQGDMTRLDLDGDLGTIEARAQGEVDRLVDPATGHLKASIEGPDLAALGSALGMDGLSAGSYELDADVGFEPGLIRFNAFELQMPSDRLALSGLLGTDAARSGTDLDVTASVGELGRWMAAIGQPDRNIGPITFEGRLLSDADGQGAVRARLEYLQSTLTVIGDLGPLAGPLQPDLDIDFLSSDISPLSVFFDDYALPAAAVSLRGHVTKPQELLLLDNVLLQLDGHRLDLKGRVNPGPDLIGSELEIDLSSPNVSVLGALFGQEGLPLAPLTLSARIERPEQRIRLQDVTLDLAGHKASANGWLNPVDKLMGSELTLEIDTADVGELALLFGQEGLPHEPMTLGADFKAIGGGVQFQTRQGTVGDIRLGLEGSIPDLDQPLGIDARFDIQLPSLRLLEFLVDDTELPDLPFSGSGTLRNEQDLTRFEDVRWRLGDIETEIRGSWHTEGQVDLSITVSGPDASQLQELFGLPMSAEPFSLKTRVVGDADITRFAEIDARVGKSQVVGELQTPLGPPYQLTGFLESPFIDLSPLTAAAEEEPETTEPASPFVFDDTEIMRMDDYDVEIDVALNAAEVDLGNTQLYDAKLHVLLDHNRLELAPFSVRGRRGGTLYGNAVLDDSGAKPVLEAELEGEDLRLGLIAGQGQSETTYPPTELHVSLQGTGLTHREMASTLSGKLRVFAGSGEIASAGLGLLFSDFLTELFTQLDPTAKESEYTPLECSVFAADIVAGQVDLEPVILHMEGLTVIAKGAIDLGSEKMNITFNTKPRKGLGVTPGTVINTLVKAGGTLKQPTIELDPQGAIVAGATAIATAGLSIVAKSFSDRFLSSKDPCGDARKDLEERDQ